MPIRNSAFLFTLFFLGQLTFASDWRPITAEDLALKQSKADPTADAECLFRDIRMENNVVGANQNITTTYIRFKIFNERGREKYANRSIEYYDRSHISDVAARTIHPDGTIIDVKRDAIFDKVEASKRGRKARVITFAFPSVEPGSIVEYRWTENKGEILYRYMPLIVQSEDPVDEVTFHLKPAVGINGGSMPRMGYLQFGCNPVMGTADSKGFVPITVRNVPAYHDEPFSPPELASRSWILVYYAENDNSNNAKFWNAVGKESYAEAKAKIRASGEIKQTAQEIVAGGKTDEEKLALLANYCRKNIKNIWGADITTEERESYKGNENSSETFRRKVGNSEDINFVFIALAQAAGFEARNARVADRRSFLFEPQLRSAYFLNNSDAAVRLNDKWKFYDVGSEFSAPGTLAWPEQGVYALLPDSKDFEWVQTPMLSSEESKIERIAEITLTPAGDVEGTIRELYWGNKATEWRIEHGRQNDAERQEAVRETLKEHYADFEVTNIKVTASPDASRPVGIAYQLSVKGYCQRTGKRLFLRPSFFTAGQLPYFTAATRANAVYFDYPWSEVDNVNIHLPAGFDLDHADAPGSFAPKPISYAVKVAIDKANNTLLYRRTFTVGTDQLLSFAPKVYTQLKAVFDEIHARDERMITLKQADPGAPAVTPTATKQ